MSLKNDINMVKEELNSEEKFFERSVITERFIKKYKNAIIGAIVLVVLLVGANVANSIYQKNKTIDVNNALTVLAKDTKNSDALLTIKKASPDLYDVWIYSTAIAQKDMLTLKELRTTKAVLVGDLANYEIAQNSKDIKALDDYASKQGAIYKDLALIQSAIIYMSENNIEKAHNELLKISPQSSLSKIASALLHYGVK
ncbi:MAG: hypothetical protein U9N33_08470 [Campylobacterota bacterium]|nr:hypothetical protein [Campylobacterota bacterium]